jgi:hypothetical protein
MTQEEIKKIKSALALPQDLRTEFYRALKHAEDEARRVQTACDHRYPDGKSSWSYGVCEICGNGTHRLKVKVY